MSVPLSDARLTELRERYVHPHGAAELLAEVDRLRAENAGLDDLRLRAIDKNEQIRAESENRRQAAAANAASAAVLQQQIDEQAHELDQLRAELATEQGKVRAASTVKCWTNEDGRRFVFAEDLAFALGYTPTTPVGQPVCQWGDSAHHGRSCPPSGSKQRDHCPKVRTDDADEWVRCASHCPNGEWFALAPERGWVPGLGQWLCPTHAAPTT